MSLLNPYKPWSCTHRQQSLILNYISKISPLQLPPLRSNKKNNKRSIIPKLRIIFLTKTYVENALKITVRIY